MKTLLFRAPGSVLTLCDLLQRAWPEGSAKQVRSVIQSGRVYVGKIAERTPDAKVPPGVKVRAEIPAGKVRPSLDVQAPHVVQSGDGWSLVVKPAGLPSHPAYEGGPDARALVSSWLGLPIDDIYPTHRLDAHVQGLWLVAHDHATARRLSQKFEERRVQKTYIALVPELIWNSGTWDGRLDSKKARTSFRVLERRGSIALVQLEPHTGRTHQLRRHCSLSGSPILGDSIYTGRMIEGGLRLASVGLHVDDEPNLSASLELELVWPQEPVYPPEEIAPLTVSAATLHALDRGHPWVLTDTETAGAGRVRRGSKVRLSSERSIQDTLDKPVHRDKKKLSVLIEGEGVVAARLWTLPRLASTLQERVYDAVHRRRAVLEHPHKTDALRLIHGEGDGVPGLHIDLLGDTLRVLQTSTSANLILQPTLRALLPLLPTPPRQVVEVIHLKRTPSGTFESVRSNTEETLFEAPPGAPTPTSHVVYERGLRFWVDAGLSEPNRARPGIGLFLDQRANRDRLSMYARRLQGRWLNLFAHTGAFSVSLLRDGVDHVTSVDLSRPYLQWIDANIALNPTLPAERHEGVRMDARRFLNSLPPGAQFEGIVLDPPTAAAVGRTFWSMRQGASELIASCLDLLAPGGVLLLTRNDRKYRGNLRELVEQTAFDHRIPLEDCIPAAPGPDFPSLRGFIEGDPFEGLIAVRGEPDAPLRTPFKKPAKKRSTRNRVSSRHSTAQQDTPSNTNDQRSRSRGRNDKSKRGAGRSNTPSSSKKRRNTKKKR